MITYGFSQQGKSHIQKGVVCQDSHRIEIMENGWYILVVADGVGSAKHSEDGSRIASETVARYCKNNILPDMTGEQIIERIKESYQIAFRQIEIFCQDIGGQIEDYDTTLTTAVYTGAEVYYGHAGDGGIIVKDSKGHYEMITVPQKGVDGISVRPLRSGSDSWEFGIRSKKVTAVLLATDGMLDTLLPPLLNIGQLQDNPMMQANKQMNVYVTLAEFFLNADSVFRNKAVKQPNQYMESFLNCDITSEQFNQCLLNAYSYMFGSETARSICKTVEDYNYSAWKMDKVTDDRTIVCAINEKEHIYAENPEYYAEPDWKTLQQQFDRLAYPSLYEENDVIQSGEYARVNLERKDREPVVKYQRERKKIKQKAESKEKISVPVSRAATQASRAYHRAMKKRAQVNIICVLGVILLAGGVLAGIKVVYDKMPGNFFSDSSQSADNPDLINSEFEYEISENEKTDKSKLKIAEKNDRKEDEVNSYFDNKKDELGSDGKGEQGTLDQESIEGQNDDFPHFVLGEDDFQFPCNIDKLKDKLGQRAQRIQIEERNDKKGFVYQYSVGNVSLVIDTVITEDSINPENIGRMGLSTTVPNKCEKVESIKMTLMNEIDEEIQQIENSMENMPGIYYEKLCIAKLGMRQDEFEQCKNSFEYRMSRYGEEETRSYGYDYRMEYQDIMYIVSVENGIVKELILRLEKE